MKKKTDDLFLLIKSLDKNEKGYFRKFSRIYSNNDNGNYLRLFDCLCKMEIYDEELVKQKFAGEKFIQQLSVTRHYLKNLIIRSLRNYYADQVPMLSNLSSFMDAFVMLKKGLTESVYNRALKESASAVKEERFPEVLLWVDLLQKISSLSGKVMSDQYRMTEYFALRMKTADQYKNMAEYEHLTCIAMDLDVFKGDASRTKTNELLANPLLQSPDAALSRKARLMYANVLSRIYRTTDDLKKAREVLSETLSYYDSPVGNFRLSAMNHFVLFNELLNSMTRDCADEMAGVITRAQKLLSLRKKEFAALERQLAESCLIEREATLFLFRNEPQKALNHLHRSAAYKREMEQSEFTLMQLWFFEAWAYLDLKDYSKALTSINNLLNSDYGEHTYLVQDAYILNILIHLELGSFAIMKRQFVMAENFVKKYEHNYNINLEILSTLKQVWKHLEKKDKTALKKSADGLLNYLSHEKSVQKAYLELWLESKLKA